MNPFTGSIDRKSYLIWIVASSLVYYAVQFSFKKFAAVLVAYGVVDLLLLILLVVRRLQNTGINMWLLLALLLPLVDILFLIALFFIPPQTPAAALDKPGASRGFKITIGVIIAVFLVLCAIVGVGLSH